MNNEQINQLINGVGLISELWVITYKSFKNQGLSDEAAVMHTKALMSIMLDQFTSSPQEEK